MLSKICKALLAAAAVAKVPAKRPEDGPLKPCAVPCHQLQVAKLAAIRKLRRTTAKFSDWKRAIFRCGMDIKGLRGDVHRYAAQVSLQIDTATAEKRRFRMKTKLLILNIDHNRNKEDNCKEGWVCESSALIGPVSPPSDIGPLFCAAPSICRRPVLPLFFQLVQPLKKVLSLQISPFEC